MKELIDAIQAAIADGASDDARAAGATACRTLLSALEAKEGEPLAPPIPVPAAPPDIDALVAGLKGVPVDQLLDLAIAKLRSVVPANRVQPVQRFSIPLVPLPRKP